MLKPRQYIDSKSQQRRLLETAMNTNLLPTRKQNVKSPYQLSPSHDPTLV
jgi:hypothetical protein